MNFSSSCNICFQKDKSKFKQYDVEINADLFGILECDYGHKTMISLSHHLFDVLFQSGIQSFIKGCLSESVMSFAAALERTYEHYIKISLNNKGQTFEQIDNFWKEVSRQSERQYGAFCGLYFLDKSERWQADSNQVGFRNKVIHQGYIATSDEAKQFGQYCLNSILQILAFSYVNFKKESTQLYFHNKVKLKEKKAKIIKSLGIEQTSVLFSGGGLNWQSDEGAPDSFDECIKAMKGVLSIQQELDKHIQKNITDDYDDIFVPHTSHIAIPLVSDNSPDSTA